MIYIYIIDKELEEEMGITIQILKSKSCNILFNSSVFLLTFLVSFYLSKKLACFYTWHVSTLTSDY